MRRNAFAWKWGGSRFVRAQPAELTLRDEGACQPLSHINRVCTYVITTSSRNTNVSLNISQIEFDISRG